MLKKESRVRHKNSEIDKEKGVMVIREIKGEFATCGYNDFNKVHQIYTFPLTELKNTND